MVCAVSTTAWAATWSETGTCVTYDLVSGKRTQKPIVTPYNLPMTSPAVYGTGNMGEVITEDDLNMPNFPRNNISAYNYTPNWENVTTTSSFPYRAIAYLEIRFPSGVETGTGFMIAPGKILTAAHCLYNLDGETPTSINVYFGRNGGSSYRNVPHKHPRLRLTICGIAI